jgi:sodium-dependent dicarboxylate transporter 2/3/5
VDVGFAEWMMLAVPVVLVLLWLCWWALVRLAFRVSRAPEPQVAEHVARARAGLGSLSLAQRRLIAVLGVTIAAWLLRSFLQWLWPGLAISDTAIAILGAVALFIVPAGDWRGPPLLQWAATRDLPWNVLILVGGGLSLGTAIQDSGLAQAAATQIHATAGWPTWAVLLSLAAATMALSHVTSNTATAATILPLAFATASSFDVGPATLGATVAMAASCAFMLPVATPPNAIVFASGHMRVMDMVRAGAVLSALALGVIMVAAGQFVPLILG